MVTYKIMTSHENDKENEITTASTIEPSILTTMIPRSKLNNFESDSKGVAFYLTMDGEFVLDTETAVITGGAKDLRRYALLNPNWHRVIFVTGAPDVFNDEILEELKAYFDARVLHIPLKRFQRLALKNDQVVVEYGTILKQLFMVMGIKLNKIPSTKK